MIKEKKKISKYNFEKSKKQIIQEYLRTIACSILFAGLITLGLSIHARDEMIRNLYAQADEQKLIDAKTAQQIIAQSNLLKDLEFKTYSVCMHVGELYETAGDFPKAQIAYELAAEKAKPGVFKPFYKLVCVLIEQEDFKKANALLDNKKDYSSKNLVKFKTRSYIVMGDKYYSLGKFLSAAKSYEKARFYYDKFSRKDKVVDKSINNRIVNAYIETADLMVKSGMNSDAIRFLKKAEKYVPDDYKVKYKLAIILSDSDPEKSVSYFNELLDKIPQEIDYQIYGTALMKAATIADLDHRSTQAKQYRYRIHDIDMFVNRKVVYKDDVDVELKSFTSQKVFFNYPLKAVYSFINASNLNIFNMKADFVLTSDDKPLETVTRTIANKENPLLITDFEPNLVKVDFKKKIFTKKELDNYTVKVYLYKDEKYKTLISETRIPKNSF